MSQDTVPQFQSSEAFRKRHKHDLNPQGAGLFQNNTASKQTSGRVFILHSPVDSVKNEDPHVFRAFISAVEKTASERHLSQDNQEKLYKWLSWAMQHAD